MIISFSLVVQLLFSLFQTIVFLVAATTGALLVILWVHFEIGTLALAPWSIAVDHGELKCSHDLICW